MRIIVGGSAGGGYDTYTRAIARHIGKHVPGNPTFVVENMTGAGTLISANHVYKVAKPDGLTIGHFVGGLMLQQVLCWGSRAYNSKGRSSSSSARRRKIRSRSESPNQPVSPPSSNGKPPRRRIKFGGVGPGAATDDATKLFRTVLGVPIQSLSVTKAQRTSGLRSIAANYRGSQTRGSLSNRPGPRKFSPGTWL